MRYDRKAIFYKLDQRENALGDLVAFYEAIDKFDVAVTPFSNEDKKLFGLERTNKMTKVLCRDRISMDASLLCLIDVDDSNKGVFYEMPSNKDLKKVFLFNCEVKEIESSNYDRGPEDFSAEVGKI
ncbi:hypothetical protein NP870_000661 [Listeria monocytogenes]|nr:hypothetical protein [Listeria monocytogenes]